MSLNETGKTYERPWGWYKTLEMQTGYQVKLIHVIPGGRLSLQSHIHRAEHWVIAKGIATITVNESIQEYQQNQFVFIPKEAKHRLENHGSMPVELIEVQMGDYLGEDDITRYDDIYGRI
ncbi:MAG: phosphomannose isomerase type II C-terminal cupin domain [Gammaproteobacteria bacterium]|jgi:mannose-6-phosphate isomerase-like protein (cupin superfamily)|nr:phosphomannose isomerase type II C-terminal cupin domain [Gammaproteobacteria bacterium]